MIDMKNCSRTTSDTPNDHENSPIRFNLVRTGEITVVFLLLFLAPLHAQTQAQINATARPTPAPISPDKKWEYVGGEKPKLVNAETKEVALESPCSLGDLGAPVWAPDSKRFAFSCSGGKQNGTFVYHQRDNKWEPLEELGNGDDLMDRAGNIIEAQAKKKGLPKKTFLHMNLWTVEADHWVDSNTLVVYAAMLETVKGRDGEHVGPTFGANALFTLMFDDAGKWKIIKTHEMSRKEIEKREKKQ